MSLTTDRNNPCINVTKENGQNACYLVLSEEEKAKGYVRPVRTSYVHIGKKIDLKGGKLITLEEMKEEDRDQYEYLSKGGYAAYIEYPESESPLVGRSIFKKELDAIKSGKTHFGGCGTLTTMHVSIAETYARDPKFYGATFCSGCGKHLPVDEFVWDGTDEEVGS